MVNEPSTLEMSDDSGSDSDSNHDEENENGSPMMSIFASYYGIEEPVDDTAPKGTIDDSNFQSESYVKVRQEIILLQSDWFFLNIRNC